MNDIHCSLHLLKKDYHKYDIIRLNLMYSDPLWSTKVELSDTMVICPNDNDVIIVNNSELGHCPKFNILGVKNTENYRMNTMHMIVAMDVFK